MMRFLDLLAMSVNNLRRRKLRTFLTVLGVVIGTASIVVMVSLGIGLNQMTIEQIKSYGSLTTIDIYNYGNHGSDKSEPLYITDDTIKQFMRIPHVVTASPILEVGVEARQGAYSGYLQLRGVNRQYMDEIPVGQGSLPDKNSKDMELVVGNTVIRNFYNSKTGKGYWDTGEMPDVDFMNKPLFLSFDTNETDAEGNSKPPKKYLIQTVGMVEGGVEDWNNYSYYVYTDIDMMKAMLKKIYKKNPIPGQPTNKKGKALGYLVYDEAYINVDDMDNVIEVQKTITDMGFQANSNMDWLEQSQKQSNMVQAVLGGIGAVSLFVAAIGIANTMMMSIYERTKEIGVIKVLGCAMENIRSMFLIEAGFIGFMGGMIGLLLSYGVSFLINKFLAASFTMGMGGDLSRIPIWLSAAAVIFAIFIGMLAGLFPALRAMKLSPLAAIRND